MRKQSLLKIVACLLAFLMLFPVFCVPAIAGSEEGGTQNVLYEQDFSNITVSQWYWMNRPESDAIVASPTDASDKVWQINLADHEGKNATAHENLSKYFNYNNYTTVVYQFDVYVGADAKGEIGLDTYTGGTTNAAGWRGFFAIDTTNDRVIGNPTHNGTYNVVSVIGDPTVTKETWHTVKLVLDLAGGSYVLYVDGAAALNVQLMKSADTTYTNVDISTYDAFLFAKAYGGAGTVYYDNFKVYEGEPSSIKPPVPMLYTQDFSSIAINNWYWYNKPASDAIVASPTDASDKVWQVNLADHDNVNCAANESTTFPKYFNYNNYSSMVYQFDVYVGADATGEVGMDTYTGNTSNSVGRVGFFAIDTTNNRVTGTPYHNGGNNLVREVGDTTVTKEAWHTIKLVIDLLGGSYVLYIDGEAAISVQLMKTVNGVVAPYRNVDLYAYDAFYFIKAHNGSGTVYYDNFKIYEEEPSASIATPIPMLYTQDFSSIAINQWYWNGRPASDAIVASPTDASDKVWQIDLADHENKNGAANETLFPKYFNYNNYSSMVYQFDVYVGADARGEIGMDAYTGNTSNNVGFRGFFAIDTTNNRVTGTPYHNGGNNLVREIGDPTLTKETWHTVSLVFDLVGGSYVLYIDGAAALHVQLRGTVDGVVVPYTNVDLNAYDAFIFAKAHEGSGTVYYDNFVIYDSSDENNVSVKTVDVDESKALLYVDVEIDGMVSRTTSASTQYLVRADQTLIATPVYFNDNGEFDAIVSNLGKTSVRYGSASDQNPAGLRFATRIDLALLAELEQLVADGFLKQISMGTLIAPTDYIQTVDGINTTPIAETLADLIPGKTVIDLPVKKGQWFDFNDEEKYPDTYFVGSIVNLKVGNYDRAFSAAGYVKVTLLSGKEVCLLADTHSADVKTVSAGVLSVFGDQLSDYAKEVLQNYIDGVSNGESERRKQVEDLQGLNVLAIGDSLFDGDFLSGDRQWIGLLAKECSWNLTNLGQDGWTVAYNPSAYADSSQVRPSMVDHLLNNADYKYGSASYYHQYNNAPSYSDNGANEVDLILLEGGTNDYGWGMPLGEVASEDIGTLYGAFNTMIETLLSTYPHARIVLVTSWHQEETRADGASRMDFVANALKNIKSTNYASHDRVLLIDAGDPAISGVNMTSIDFRQQYGKSTGDVNHLNAEGMKLVAQNIVSPLWNTLVASRKAEYEASVEVLKNLDVLAIGDSLTDGYAASIGAEGQWMGLLAKECAWNMTNIGRGARTVAYAPAVYDAGRDSIWYELFNSPNSFCYNTTDSRYTNIGNTSNKNNGDIDLVFLQGGVNDYQMDIPLGEIDSTSEGELIGAWRQIIDEILERYPNAKIVLITTWYFDETRTSDGANRQDFSADTLKAVYSEYYADSERISLIDAGNPLVSRVYMEDSIFRTNFCVSSADTHHLNEKGMEMMASAMITQLAALFEKSSAEE